MERIPGGYCKSLYNTVSYNEDNRHSSIGAFVFPAGKERGNATILGHSILRFLRPPEWGINGWFTNGIR